MTTIVLLGGNGYIGRNVTKEWLRKDPTAIFYIVSRSGKNSLKHPALYNIAADVTNFEEVIRKLPEQVDYIVDFIGRPEKDETTFYAVNDQPADVMLQIAINRQVKAMGFIGGTLGPKKFIEGKKRICQKLNSSGIKTVTVEPTIVYGEDRSDFLAKMIPLFNCLGLFIRTMKPVHVQTVANELVTKIVED